ncbi:MAG: phosphoglycerate dehydrogenase [Micavibrio sp.]|nr:phosphoglycerate dehydrogenase [Micavibrio sp.]|tara:strand:- start:2646 stop:4226 length:1581 start_codon:yes stop_codon:yes gene_type:complete
MPKVLISDDMSPLATEIFKQRGIEVDVKTNLSPHDLGKIIGDYDGLTIRSSTTVTPELMAKAKNLKVIGRAGIGVDNVDLTAATKAGIIVMNTPFGNATTAAEHAIAMMMAMVRQIPQASASTHQGLWEKKKFMGMEVTGKTLGLIGCGNIGAIVASRAIGLKMKVIAFDPFLTDEKAVELGVEKGSLDELYARADVVTVHTPLNDKTRGLLNKEAFAKMKPGVRVVNCARGGIVVEKDLKEALDSGHVAAAALDVFEEEPAKENILFGHPNVICTPHLGASTEEAQVNVAVQVAEQMSDYLLQGAVTNAVNMASISAEDAPRLKPYLSLAAQLGSFAGQIAESAIKKIIIEYAGHVAGLNVKPLSSTIIAEILRPSTDTINIVSAPVIAKDKGIEVTESLTDKSAHGQSHITVRVVTENKERSVTGTLYGQNQPRLVSIENVPIEAALAPYMLYIRNEDKPGLVGGVGTILGAANCNIADFRLGRQEGGEALAMVSIDTVLSDDILVKLQALPQAVTVKLLKFTV